MLNVTVKFGDNPAGWIPTGKAARCKLDSLNPVWDYKPRWETSEEWAHLNEGNAIVPTFLISTMSKDTVKLDNYPAWKAYFQSFMTPELWDYFIQPGVGWFDLSKPDELKFNPLECSCGLVHVTGSAFYAGDMYVPIESMDINSPPDWSKTPENSPHLFIKQTLITRSSDTFPHGRTKVDLRKPGDVYLPLVSTGPLCMRLEELEIYSPGHLFTDKTVYKNGAVIDEMVCGISESGFVTGDGRDRRGYSVGTHPPPWIGRMYPETW